MGENLVCMYSQVTAASLSKVTGATSTGASCSTGNTLSDSSVETERSSHSWLRPSSCCTSLSSWRSCVKMACNRSLAVANYQQDKLVVPPV